MPSLSLYTLGIEILSSGGSRISQTHLGGTSDPKEEGANLSQIFHSQWKTGEIEKSFSNQIRGISAEEKSGNRVINWPISFRKLYKNF